MLVLSRKVGDEIVVPQFGLVFTILEVWGDKVRVGVSAPRDVHVHRREVWERIQADTALDKEVVLPAGEVHFKTK